MGKQNEASAFYNHKSLWLQSLDYIIILVFKIKLLQKPLPKGEKKKTLMPLKIPPQKL